MTLPTAEERERLIKLCDILIWKWATNPTIHEVARALKAILTAEPQDDTPDDCRADYASMDGPTLLSTCGDSGAKWAAAFMQIVIVGKKQITWDSMLEWFAHAIEHSYYERNSSKQRLSADAKPRADTAHHVADRNLVGDGIGVGLDSLPPVAHPQEQAAPAEVEWLSPPDLASELAATLVEVVRKQSNFRNPEELAEFHGEFQTAIEAHLSARPRMPTREEYQRLLVVLKELRDNVRKWAKNDGHPNNQANDDLAWRVQKAIENGDALLAPLEGKSP